VKKVGWGVAKSRGPLSIEEILQKKKEADEAAAKVCLVPLSFGGVVSQSGLIHVYSFTNYLYGSPNFYRKLREKNWHSKEGLKKSMIGEKRRYSVTQKRLAQMVMLRS
jgi:hypothetical protein